MNLKRTHTHERTRKKQEIYLWKINDGERSAVCETRNRTSRTCIFLLRLYHNPCLLKSIFSVLIPSKLNSKTIMNIKNHVGVRAGVHTKIL